MPKGLYPFLCKHAMGFFILPARHQSPLEAKQDLPSPGTQCLPQGCGARGWAAEGQGDGLPFAQKSKVTLSSPLMDFGSSPKDGICPLPVGAGHGAGAGRARLRG